MTNFQQFAAAIGRDVPGSNRPLVCIQGLGFVGAAMATAVANAVDENGVPYYNVIGVDLPNDSGHQRVAAINAGHFPMATSDRKLETAMEQAFKAGNLIATTDPECYRHAAIAVVDVHLDIPFLDERPRLEMDGFRAAIRTLGERLPEGALVLVETTVPPGTCEKVVVPTLAQALAERSLPEDALLVAHSYERVMPGSDYYDSIVNYWRVFSGHTPAAADACETFLGHVINVDEFPLTRLKRTVASETAKVMENTFRAVNIAFVDEWSRYAEAVGIDLFEVVSAIGMRPTHRNIRRPGFGVGGYCLTKDPTFAPAAVEQLFELDPVAFPFSALAVQVNHRMPLAAARRLESLLDGSLEGRTILLLGVSYREDVADTRYSPSETFLRDLEAQGARVVCHDPYVRSWEELEREVSAELPAAAGVDAVVLAVAHQQFRELDYGSWLGDARPVFLDANNVLSDAQRDALRGLGARVESIGRADGL